MLYLISNNGKTLPRSIPAIREIASFPFTVECTRSIDEVAAGEVLKVIGFKLGKYQTEDGQCLSGHESAWLLIG